VRAAARRVGELLATLTPTEVAVRRKGRRQVHKSDLIDAELCARIGREQQATLRRLVAVPEAVAEVRVLARYQDGLIGDRKRLINRLRFLLSQYWPEFLAARAFAARRSSGWPRRSCSVRPVADPGDGKVQRPDPGVPASLVVPVAVGQATLGARSPRGRR
jgi:hypothetical protein